MMKALPIKAPSQALLFLIVGATAAAVHFVALIALVSVLDLTPALANVGAFFMAFGVSFLGHFHLTFKPTAALLDSQTNNGNNIINKGDCCLYPDILRRAPCGTINNNNQRHHLSDCTFLLYQGVITKPSFSTKKTSPLHALIKWFASSALGFLVNQALFMTLLYYFGTQHYPLIWLVVTGIITVMTFALGKFWAFNHD